MAVATSDLKEPLRRVFKKEFPEDTVDVSEDEHGHLQVMVVSRRFDGMGEKEKLDWLWDIGRDGLKKTQLRRISLLLGYSPQELL
jgi:acid stress-induced BolA-like protein IbaG/YrbA